ncbi:hypothetical protein FJTKL_10892 [Diaporthe vaccinii]|uniref:Uncharacterized protein n=1 Tax=Diaporthe vaccinii TaxID=105482 RepID=A0ABR4FC56_9PEZI
MAVTVCLWYGSRLVGAIHPHSQVLMTDLDGGLISLMVTVSSSDQHTLTNTPPFCDFGVEMVTLKKVRSRNQRICHFWRVRFTTPGCLSADRKLKREMDLDRFSSQFYKNSITPLAGMTPGREKEIHCGRRLFW